jgi:hypothetical protein
MDEHKHHYRRNGLERPWGYAQIGAWMVYVVSILQFCVFIIPTLSPCIASPILSLLFILSIIYVFIYASDTILKNPIDIHLQHHLAQQQQQQENHTDGEANGTICNQDRSMIVYIIVPTRGICNCTTNMLLLLIILVVVMIRPIIIILVFYPMKR